VSAVLDRPHQMAREKLLRWQSDAVAFVQECIGVEPDAWQHEALTAISNPDVERLAMKACKGPGKTACEAWIILWFLVTRVHSKIACTSITADNLSTNLWPELAKWISRSEFLKAVVEWGKTRIVVKEAPEQWFAVARAWSQSADPQQQAEALAGIHADHVLFVLDESGGMPQALMTTAEAVLATGKETKIVQAGNPTSIDGPLYRACVTDRALWHVVTITGDPDDPNRSPRIKKEWAQTQINQYGRDNPWVKINVLGEFPPSSINSLLGPSDVDGAMLRILPAASYDWAQVRIGVDVARYGDDRTVIFPRQGLMAFQPRIMRHSHGSAVSADIATAVMSVCSSFRTKTILMDATGGWAAGARDLLVVAGYHPLEVQFHAPCRTIDGKEPKYKNRRAEMHFGLSEWVKGGGVLPNMPELLGELTTPTYTVREDGKFQIEAKEQVKERLGRSPDLADALALTFAIPEMLTLETRKARHDDDPADRLYGKGKYRQQGTGRRGGW
jgi:phage terminase large subunit